MSWEPDYVTLPDVKSYQRIDDTADDALLGIWVTAASRAVDTYCGRQFGQVDAPEARTYRGSYDRHTGAYVTQIDDLQDVTGLTIAHGDVVDVTGYELLPLNAASKGRAYTRVACSTGASLTITARWGWSAVPAAVKTATLLQAARFAARRDSPYGVAGSPAEGSEVRLLATLDPDLKTALGAKYRREWWAV